MDKVERWSRVGIIYHLELPEGEIFVSTNELYLSLVIENLLDNANKFTDSGSITLKMRLDKAQSKLRIEVTDTGCGIPHEKHQVVFERFIKLNDFAQGTGLGLSICKLIIQKWGGEIWVDPAYTKGARFVFTHPIVK